MHDEKAESRPVSPGKPDRLYLNLSEKKICISYKPTNASDSNNLEYLIVSENASPNAIGPNYNLQILNDIFSESSQFNIKAIVANAQKNESTDYFILSLLGTAPWDFNYIKFGRYMYRTSDTPIDAPIVLNNYKDEPLIFIYGAWPNDGILSNNFIFPNRRLWWVPVQAVERTKDNICDSVEWVQLPTNENRFDLYYNSSNKSQGYDYPLIVRVVGTPLFLTLDTVTFPIQIFFIFNMN